MTKKTAPLFDPRLILEDLQVAALSLLAQLFYFKLCALADAAGGVVMVNGRVLTLQEAASLCRFAPQGLEGIIAEILGSGLIAREGADGPFVIPDMVARAALRGKRAQAGRKGGARTTVKRLDVCSSKRRDNVIYLEKSKHYKFAAAAEQKKKKNQKEKNNNKYNIYLYHEKVRTDDRGTPENPEFIRGDHFTLWKREYRALQAQFPLFTEEKLDALLGQHDRWLGEQGEGAQAAWLACLLGFLRKVHAGEARAAAFDGRFTGSEG